MSSASGNFLSNGDVDIEAHNFTKQVLGRDGTLLEVRPVQFNQLWEVLLDSETYVPIAFGKQNETYEFVSPLNYVQFSVHGTLLQYVPWQFAGKTLEPGPIVISGIEMILDIEGNSAILETTFNNEPIRIKFDVGETVWPTKISIDQGNEWQQTWSLEETHGSAYHIAMPQESEPIPAPPVLPDTKHPDTSDLPISLPHAMRLSMANSPEFFLFVQENPNWIASGLNFQELGSSTEGARYSWEYTVASGKTVWQIQSEFLIPLGAPNELLAVYESGLAIESTTDVDAILGYQSMPYADLAARCQELYSAEAVETIAFGRENNVLEYPFGGLVREDIITETWCLYWDEGHLEGQLIFDSRSGQVKQVQNLNF